MGSLVGERKTTKHQGIANLILPCQLLNLRKRQNLVFFQRGSPTEDSEAEAIASEVINLMQKDYLYIIGSGTTIQPIMKKLRLTNTLLGVDLAVLGMGEAEAEGNANVTKF